jgi:hypothetical protein
MTTRAELYMFRKVQKERDALAAHIELLREQIAELSAQNAVLWDAVKDANRPADQPLDALAQEEAAHGHTIDQRDRYHEIADELAAAIGAITGTALGEHSSLNCPWQNALDAASTYRTADQQAGCTSPDAKLVQHADKS